MSWTIGVDIGGTFTDLVAIHSQTGARLTRKILTTPDEPLVGVLRALDLFEEATGSRVAQATAVIHATTLATNTLLERKGARAALLTTLGFRDVIETGREDRYDLYDLQIEVQPPLIVRDRRIGIDERMDAQGNIVQPIDRAQVESAIRGLPADTESVAVCFLHSYANPDHERLVGELVRRLRPEAHVTLSSDVAPIMREYERFTAAAINAYVGPRVGDYLARFERELATRNFTGFIGIMKSDGGMCTPDEASRLPARVLESGPAAGILSAAQTATRRGEALAVAFDMGGTTAKACVITNGEPVITDELEVARLARFTKHSGLPLRLPSLDLIEIGAGGGSIASISEIGFLQVGPESAASVPGPACYGRGGDRPTVTDVDLVLGYLNAESFAGGFIALDRKAAEKAISQWILEPTQTRDLVAAAWGVNDLVNENMAREIRLHCVEQGIDPSSATLIATGGAGPLHAAHVMSKLGIARMLCPPDVGVASAVGLLLAPRSVERTVTEVVLLKEVGAAGVHGRLARLQGEVRNSAHDFGDASTVSFVLHMRLRGQAYELAASVSSEPSEDELVKAFGDAHMKRFGRPPAAGSIEVVTWSAINTLPSRLPSAPRHRPQRQDLVRASRQAYFGPSYGWTEVRVVGRSMLEPGEVHQGPMLIEDDGSTIVVIPGQVVYEDEWGNLCVELA